MAKVYDPLQSYLCSNYERSSMNCMFEPKTIALVGATERKSSVGRALFLNMTQQYPEDIVEDSNFNYTVYPVNPTRKECFGKKCYDSLLNIPVVIDLVVIVTPAKTVLGIVQEAAEKKVPAILIISSGFKESGPEGIGREKAILDIAKKNGIRILGPNCLGFMNVAYNLNATFANCMTYRGTTAFLSQSGALCTAVLDWAVKVKIGFSAFVSVGSMSDIDWGDLVDYLGHDPNTKSILMYIESIGNARKFLSAAKEIAISKPIIVIKAGKSRAAYKAAASHTGSLVGNYDAFISAMKRIGVLVVDTIEELFNCALVLNKMPRPKGPKLLILTNAGGPAVIAADALDISGAELSILPRSTIDRIEQIASPGWSKCNPVDILGDATPQDYVNALKILDDEEVGDGLLIILSPQDITDPTQVAELIIPIINKIKEKIPVICSWMGANEVAMGQEILVKAGIPEISNPDTAAQTFAIIWCHTKHLREVYETPHLEDVKTLLPKAKETALSLIKSALSKGLLTLGEVESKQILKAYGLPVNETFTCTTEEEAIKVAQKIGYPVACKLYSHIFTHKSDVGGVFLNIKSDDELCEAYKSIKYNAYSAGSYTNQDEVFSGVTIEAMLSGQILELIIGSTTDLQMGPLILFGTGGIYVEIFKDTAIALPPLNDTLAKHLMMKTRIYKAFERGSKRFPHVSIDELALILTRFSNMVVDLSCYMLECDINPLCISIKTDQHNTNTLFSNNISVLDARFTLRSSALDTSPLVVRPYPKEYIWTYKIQTSSESLSSALNGHTLLIRPIQAADEPKMVEFHKQLSTENIKKQYVPDVSFTDLIAYQRLIAICCADYDRSISLVAISEDEHIFGIVRMHKLPARPNRADIRIVVINKYQGLGIGRFLLTKAVNVAESEGIEVLSAHVLDENIGALKVLKQLGFSMEKVDEYYYCQLILTNIRRTNTQITLPGVALASPHKMM
ncbi:putative acetyl-CoA synthetase [Cryptosporidium serpentis]